MDSETNLIAFGVNNLDFSKHIVRTNEKGEFFVGEKGFWAGISRFFRIVNPFSGVSLRHYRINTIAKTLLDKKSSWTDTEQKLAEKLVEKVLTPDSFKESISKKVFQTLLGHDSAEESIKILQGAIVKEEKPPSEDSKPGSPIEEHPDIPVSMASDSEPSSLPEVQKPTPPIPPPAEISTPETHSSTVTEPSLEEKIHILYRELLEIELPPQAIVREGENLDRNTLITIARIFKINLGNEIFASLSALPPEQQFELLMSLMKIRSQICREITKLKTFDTPVNPLDFINEYMSTYQNICKFIEAQKISGFFDENLQKLQSTIFGLFTEMAACTVAAKVHVLSDFVQIVRASNYNILKKLDLDGKLDFDPRGQAKIQAYEKDELLRCYEELKAMYDKILLEKSIKGTLPKGDKGDVVVPAVIKEIFVAEIERYATEVEKTKSDIAIAFARGMRGQKINRSLADNPECFFGRYACPVRYNSTFELPNVTEQ